MRSFSAYVAYAAYRAVELAARLMPLMVCWYAGVILGKFFGLVFRGYRRLALRNLTIAFGDTMSRREIRALMRRHFALLGGNLLTSLKLPWMSDEAVSRRFSLEGIEEAEKAIAGGRGMIYALCHTGNWEVLTRSGSVAPGTKRGAMFQRLGNLRLNDHIVRCRSNTGCRLFDRRDGFGAPAAWLRENGVLGILVDQHAGDGGVWCPFFGRLASTTSLAQLLSRRTGAPVLPAAVITTGPARWTMAIGKPLRGAADGLTTDQATAEMNLRLEELVRRSPADWFWVHNRWKTPNPDFLLARYKRGIALPDGWTTDRLKRFEVLIRSPNWLGDACMSVPAVRAIRRGRPDARVTILTPANLAPMWRRIPEVDSVIAMPKAGGLAAAVWRIRRSGTAFDAAVLFPNSLRSALEVWLAGIPRRVGFRGHWRRRLLNQIVPPRRKASPIRHHSRHYLFIALRLGATRDDRSVLDPLEIPPDDRPNAPSADAPGRLALCAGAEYGPAKRWPLERFAAAAGMVSQEVLCEVVLLGGPRDKAQSRQLEGMLGGHCVNLTGRTTLDELMTELLRSRVLLTNDTGTMHLAALLGVPVVAIFGSTEPAWTGPAGDGHTVIRHHVPCSPCFLRECPLDFRCMLTISPETVAEAVLAKWDEKPKAAADQ